MTWGSWIAGAWPVAAVDILIAGLALRTLWQLRAAQARLVERQRRLPELEKPRPINRESLGAAEHALTDVVSRGISALEALDRKATLIPPALGVIAGIAVPRVAREALDDPFTMAAGISTLAASLLSAAAALAVFFPRGYKAGPEPIESALTTGDSEVSYRQGVVNALARAGVSIEGVVTHRSAFFFLSVVFLGATILMLTLFAVSGGFIGGEAGSGA